MASNVVHICTSCGDTASESALPSKFYLSDSPYHKKINRIPLCKTCVSNMCLDFDGSFNINRFLNMLCVCDKPYLSNLLEQAKESSKNKETGNIEESSIVGHYMRLAVMKQYRGLTWNSGEKPSINDDSIKEDSSGDKLNRWGSGWTENQYERLEYFYHDMKRGNDIESPQALDYLKKISMLSIQIDDAIRLGETQKAKQLGDLYSKYMSDSKFRTMDLTDSDRTGGIRNFGTIYLEVEKPDFIPPWEHYSKLLKIKQDIVDKTIMHLENFTLKFNKAEKMIEPPYDTPLQEEGE